VEIIDMNKTLLLGGLAALALAATAGVAAAQQAPEARGMRADADGDGRISQSEFVGRRIERLTTADADRDGSVTAAEMQAVAQDRMARRANARFDQLDADKNGSISRAEFDDRLAANAARAEAAPRAGRGWGGRRGGEHRMARMEARGPIAIAEVQARTEQAFARIDADHDGYLTAEERHAARDGMRQHRRGARQAPQASPPAPASE
jgi:hypothetical protein